MLQRGLPPKNYGKKYAGVFLNRGKVGITCSYLSKTNQILKSILKVIKYLVSHRIILIKKQYSCDLSIKATCMCIFNETKFVF